MKLLGQTFGLIAVVALVAAQLPDSSAQDSSATPTTNPATTTASSGQSGDDSGRRLFDGEVTSTDQNALEICTCNLDGVIGPQQFLVPDETPITLDGQQANLGNLQGGLLARVQGRTAGDVIVADAIDAITPSKSGDGSSPAQVIFAAGGGGGNSGGNSNSLVGDATTSNPFDSDSGLSDLPDINLPNVNVPDVEIPDVLAELPDVTVSPSGPEINFDAPDVTVNGPTVTVDLPDVNVETSEVTVTLPDVDIHTPTLRQPQLPELGTPNVGVPEVPADQIPGTPNIEGIKATIAGALNEAGENRQIVRDQLSNANAVVDRLRTGVGGKLNRAGDVLAPKFEHTRDVLNASVDQSTDRAAQLKQQLANRLGQIAATLREMKSAAADRQSELRTELTDHISECLNVVNELAASGDETVAGTKETVQTVNARLTQSLESSRDNLVVLADAGADKIDSTEHAAVQALLNLRDACDALIADTIGRAGRMQAVAANRLRSTADALETAALLADETVDENQAQLISQLRDTADTLDVWAAAESAQEMSEAKLNTLRDEAISRCADLVATLENFPQTLDAASDRVGSTKQFLVSKLRQCADAITDLKSETIDAAAGTLADKRARVRQSLSDIAAAAGVMTDDVREQVASTKAAVGQKLSELGADVTGNLDADTSLEVAQLIRLDSDIDAQTAQRISDSITAGAILDSETMAELGRIIAVDVNSDALADAELLRQLITQGEIDGELAARLAPIVMLDSSLNADSKARIAQILRGDIESGIELNAALRSRLIGAVVVKIDRDTPAMQRLARLLRANARAIRRTIGSAPEEIANRKQQVAQRLEAAADAASDLATATRGRVMGLREDANELLAEKRSELNAQVNAAAEACVSLAGELQASVEAEAASQLSASMQRLNAAVNELAETKGEAFADARNRLQTTIEEARFQIGLLRFMLNERIATIHDRLMARLDEAATALERPAAYVEAAIGASKDKVNDTAAEVRDTTNSVGNDARDAIAEQRSAARQAARRARLELASKLRSAATAAQDVKQAAVAKAGETKSDVRDRTAAAKDRLANTLREAADSADQYVARIESTKDSAESKLAGRLRNAADSLQSAQQRLKQTAGNAAEAAANQSQAAREAADRTAMRLQDAAARKLSHVGDAAHRWTRTAYKRSTRVKHRLAATLRRTADVIETQAENRVESVQNATEARLEQIRERKARLVTRLRTTADAVETLADATRGRVGDTKQKLAERTQLAAERAADQMDAAVTAAEEYVQALQATPDRAEAKLAVALNRARNAARRLNSTLQTQLGERTEAAAEATAEVRAQAVARARAAVADADEAFGHSLQDCIETAMEVVASFTGVVPDARSELAMRLRQTADQIESTIGNQASRLTGQVPEADQARRRIVRRLRTAADAADRLAVAVMLEAEAAAEAGVEAGSDAANIAAQAVVDARARAVAMAEGDLAGSLETAASAAEQYVARFVDVADSSEQKLSAALRVAANSAARLKSAAADQLTAARTEFESQLRDVNGQLRQSVEGLTQETGEKVAAVRERLPNRSDLQVMLNENAQLNQASRTAIAQLVLISNELAVAERITLAQRVLTGDANLDSATTATIRRVLSAEVVADADRQTRIAETLADATDLDAAVRADVARVISSQAVLDADARAVVSRALSGEAELDTAAVSSLRRLAEAQANVAANVSQFDTLLSGPVHEAFMQPFNGTAASGVVVQATPPKPLREIAPRFIPQGDDIQWIPGYWSAMPGQNGDSQFVWVSGTFRRMPPGRKWMSGGWVQVADGHQWTPGAWVPEDFSVQSSVVDATPTAIADLGPVGEAPSANHMWVPPQHVLNDGQIVVQDGFWSEGNQNWVWTPARLIPTANGVIPVSGYWDHTISRRGQLFAPARFQNLSQIDSNVPFSPGVALDAERIALHLFVDPQSQQFLFGDFYGEQFTDLGITPWYQPAERLGGYDPILGFHARRMSRNGAQLTQRLRSWNQYFTGQVDARPPRTVAEFANFVQANAENQFATRSVLAANLQEVAEANGYVDRLAAADADQGFQLDVASGLVIPGAVNSSSMLPGIGVTIPDSGFWANNGIVQTSGTNLNTDELPDGASGVVNAGGASESAAALSRIPGGGLSLPNVGNVPGTSGVPSAGSIPNAGSIPGTGALPATGQLPNVGGLPGGGVGGAGIGSGVGGGFGGGASGAGGLGGLGGATGAGAGGAGGLGGVPSVPGGSLPAGGNLP